VREREREREGENCLLKHLSLQPKKKLEKKRKESVLTVCSFVSTGHFIQHCPTNGDAKFDIIRAKPPNGSYTLSSGAVALKPNE